MVTNNFIKALKDQKTNLHKFEEITCMRAKIDFVNVCVRCMFVSSFFIVKNFHEVVVSLEHELDSFLFEWREPAEEFRDFNNIAVPLDCSMLRIRSSRFTLWNLIEYREKLLLLDSFFSYQRTMNGHCKRFDETIGVLVNFIDFVSVNTVNLEKTGTSKIYNLAKANLTYRQMHPDSSEVYIGQ